MSLGLPPRDIPKAMTFVRLLGSDVDGEALNAARALGRTLQRNGKDFHDLAALITIQGTPAPQQPWTPPPDYRWEEEDPPEPEPDPESLSPNVKDLTREQQRVWLRLCLDEMELEVRDEVAAVKMAQSLAGHSYWLNREQLKLLNRLVKRAWREVLLCHKYMRVLLR